jgi:hypothetical protein
MTLRQILYLQTNFKQGVLERQVRTTYNYSGIVGHLKTNFRKIKFPVVGNDNIWVEIALKCFLPALLVGTAFHFR